MHKNSKMLQHVTTILRITHPYAAPFLRAAASYSLEYPCKKSTHFTDEQAETQGASLACFRYCDFCLRVIKQKSEGKPRSSDSQVPFVSRARHNSPSTLK